MQLCHLAVAALEKVKKPKFENPGPRLSESPSDRPVCITSSDGQRIYNLSRNVPVIGTKRSKPSHNTIQKHTQKTDALNSNNNNNNNNNNNSNQLITIGNHRSFTVFFLNRIFHQKTCRPRRAGSKPSTWLTPGRLGVQKLYWCVYGQYT